MTNEIQTGAPLLTAAGSEASRLARGKLKVFFGMAPGVGKTRAMLQAAQKERLAGRDVVLVCLEDSATSEKGLSKGLNTVSRSQQLEPPPAVPGFELDTVLARRPDVAVVDALASDNGPGCRHPKRYLDVLEMLEAGIDVFTTLNVGQVASWSDDARRIVGGSGVTSVPDTMLDRAELELVDLAPRELLKRISRGEARFTAAEAAKSGFLDEAKLAALRDLSVHLFAQRIGRDLKEHSHDAKFTGRLPLEQRLLAVVRPGYDNEPVVRWTRRLANGFHAEWIALYVEPLHAARNLNQPQITGALTLARELGGDVVTTNDDDPVSATLRVASQRSVTQVIVGKAPESAGALPFRRDPFLRGLLRQGRNLSVHLFPLENSQTVERRAIFSGMTAGVLGQYVTALAVIILVTLAAFLFTPVVGAHSTALVYLLTIVLLALFVERGPTLAAAAMSALCWDYFFLPPVFAFQIRHFEDAMLFALYFVVALVLGHLTTRIRAQEGAEREREHRATALYLLTRDLNESVDLEQMVQRIVQQLGTCFRAEVAVLLPHSDGSLRACLGSNFHLPINEQDIPQSVFQRGQRAGKLTDNFSFATALYVPLLTSGGPVGVLALRADLPLGWNLHQENLLDAISQQIAMALDRHRLNGISEKARLLAESERLSKTLLDSMSHEIRTPIAAIQSASGNLAELPDGDKQTRGAMLAEIHEATERLNRLVGNMLEASRLESGAVRPRLNECDVSELIHVVLERAEKELAAHKITVAIEPHLPVIPMDFVLMQQVLANLVSNAALHTPPGTAIEIGARLENDMLVLTVADRGPGIPTDSLPRIFDKFYRVPNSRTGGTGLGLSLVKGFVEAQGGLVTVRNRPGSGVAFDIRLPRSNPSLTAVNSQI